MIQKQKRKHFSKEVRENAVKLVIDGGRKCGEVAAEHQIPVASIYNWVRQARLDSEASAGEGDTISSLKRDNLRLRKELKNAQDHALFLRRTAAFFASEKL